MSNDLQGSDIDVTAISHASAALLRAVNAGDLAGVLAMWSDDGVLMPPHHPSVNGHDEIARYFTRLFERSRFTFSFTNARIVEQRHGARPMM